MFFNPGLRRILLAGGYKLLESFTLWEVNNVNKTELSENGFELWQQIGRVNHAILLIRQQELRQLHIPVRQFHLLIAIRDLGPNATLSELSKRMERGQNVISEQTMRMETEGLIRRIKETPRSTLLKIEVTQKGLNLIRFGRESKIMSGVFSSISEKESKQLKSILNKILIQAQNYASAAK